ncbi:MAG: AAA family ATPase [Candidatus Dojkabacteria bacterium]
MRNVIHLSATNQKHGRVTILFIDEIHRWSKAQQDALLPYVESGQIVLIGATTGNPSFTIIAPLISRARVFVFQAHGQEDVVQALQRGRVYLSAVFRLLS